MPQTMTPYGRPIGTFGRDGHTHLGGAPNVVSNPAVDTHVHPAHAYFALMGVPDGVDPNNIDDLPYESHTVQSKYAGQPPTQMKRFIVTDGLDPEFYQHFTVCPPVDSSANPEGIGTMILRFGNQPLSEQPEGSSPTFIRHRFESTKVHLKRYGQGIELFDDFARLPDGKALYNAYLDNMTRNTALSGMMAVMIALLHCYDPKRDYVARYGGSNAIGRYHGLDELNRLFGALHKTEKAYYQVADFAAGVAKVQAVGGRFTHVFVTQRVLSQIAFGDPFESEYFRKGPGNMEMLKNGSAAVTRMQDGTTVVVEPDQEVDGTSLQPGQKIQLLENIVSTGRYNMVLHDDSILTAANPDPRTDMSLGFLNLDIGDGQIQVQKFADLVRAAVCWQEDGNLRQRAYEEMTSDSRAEQMAELLGIGGANLRPPGAVVPLIDPFIAVGNDNIRTIVRTVGNMDVAYLGIDVQARIAAAAYRTVRTLLTEDEFKLMRFALDFAEDAKNADPTSGYSMAFASALIAPVTAAGAPGHVNVNVAARRLLNAHGVPDIPSVAEVVDSYNALNPPGAGGAPADIGDILANPRVAFPGFSSIKHLRTVRDFVQRFDAAWVRALGGAFAELEMVAKGVGVLDKFARACRLIWSTTTAPNAFFRRSALPFWNRSNNAQEDELDAFIQNIILGIGYPTGIRARADNPGNALVAGIDPMIDRRYRRFTDAAANANRIVDPAIEGFFAALGIDVNGFGDIAARRTMLEASYNNGAFGDTAVDFFPNAFLDSEPAAGKTAVAVTAHLTNLFERLVARKPDGTEQTGLAAVTDIITERVKPIGNTNDVAVRNNLVDARIRAIAAIRNKVKAMADDTAGPANVKLVADYQDLSMAAYIAAMTTRPGLAGNKRKVVRVGDENVVDAAQGAAQPVNAVSATSQYVNTTLSFAAQRWREAFTARNVEMLVPADPMDPVNSWLAPGGPRGDGNAAQEYYGMAARERYHIDDTCMGKVAGAAFADAGAAERAPKRARMAAPDEEGFGGRIAGAQYAYVPPRRDVFGVMPEGVRNTIRDDHLNVDGTTVDYINPRMPAPHRLAPTSALAQGANKSFQWRWRHTVDNFAGDVVLLAQHLLFLGTAVHRDAFVNMIEHGVPPPMGVVTVDPFIRFSMTHAVFAVAGCGNLYYAFPDLATSYDGMHKITHAYLTIWMKAHVHLPQNVFIAENVAFNGYLGGGDGSLVRSIWSPHDETVPAGGYDFDPANPADRRAHRFVLHVGANTRREDLPNPLPLTGTFGGRGAYHGVGRFVDPGQSGTRKQGALYDSALMANAICMFYMLNRDTSANDLAGAFSFVQRNEMVAETYNMLCYMADQWTRNQASGAYTERCISGTGPLGRLGPGVVPILQGTTPGLIEKKLAISMC